MKFKSKRDIFMGILYGLAVYLFIGVPILYNQFSWVTILFLFIPGIIFVYMWAKTEYYIQEEHLIIKYGPFRFKISLESITSIRNTKKPFVAPSLSIDRLEINYFKYKTIAVSPKEKEKFIKELLRKNPNIKVIS